MPGDLSAVLSQGDLIELPITVAHAELAGSLPPHHADPFDRMLVAQAMLEGLTIVTRDPDFARYGVPLLEA
jgi:PIN domain nuclease of toxin-antitoxin system